MPTNSGRIGCASTACCRRPDPIPIRPTGDELGLAWASFAPRQDPVDGVDTLLGDRRHLSRTPEYVIDVRARREHHRPPTVPLECRHGVDQLVPADRVRAGEFV